MALDENKKKALDAAIAKLEKDFGKGTVMKLGDSAAQVWPWDWAASPKDVSLRSTDRSPAVRRRLPCT